MFIDFSGFALAARLAYGTLFWVIQMFVLYWAIRLAIRAERSRRGE